MNKIVNASILPQTLPNQPMHLAKLLFDDACLKKNQPNPNAMTLVTASEGNQPSARIVLCKSFIADPGYVVFFTNYRSRKGREIMHNPKVSLVFHWDQLGRQIRIEGKAILSSPEESDAYFKTRNLGSQLSAWGSDQSQPVESRKELIDQIKCRADKLGLIIENSEVSLKDSENSTTLPRPPHWGGIQIWASTIELWMDGEDRVHDRAAWTRELKPTDNNIFSTSKWLGTRLQP
jgi:pyridoxamine 5'-phosphate oxidase